MVSKFNFTNVLKIKLMPSWKNKQRQKRKDLVKAKGYFVLVPDFDKDIRDLRAGKINRLSPKDERIQAFVQARGM